ncbi:MAG: molybdenum cofactor guanylyltransferase, partial [Brucella anthropi]
MQQGGVAGDKFLQPLGSTGTIISHVVRRIKPQ